jgi:nucleoside-diphosphate-sugar epimerase
VRPSIEDPARYPEVNVGGAQRALEFARRHDVGRFVFGSSSSVYGEREEVPFSEDDRVDHHISPYAATKRAGELLSKPTTISSTSTSSASASSPSTAPASAPTSPFTSSPGSSS